MLQLHIYLKNIFYTLPVLLILFSCATTENADLNNSNSKMVESDTVRISDNEEYEIIIIDNGFSIWLNKQPSQDYYSQRALEIKNYRYVQEWNLRVNNPSSYNPDIYSMRIDYDPSVDYGMEVNYKLFQYFEYIQSVYKQKF